MPKDHWRAASNRQKARQVSQEKRSKRRRNSPPNAITLGRLQQPTTRLWFGKYRGRTLSEIANIDTPYLKWLLELPEHKHPNQKWLWRIRELKQTISRLLDEIRQSAHDT